MNKKSGKPFVAAMNREPVTIITAIVFKGLTVT